MSDYIEDMTDRLSDRSGDIIAKVRFNGKEYDVYDEEMHFIVGDTSVIEGATAPENTTKIWKDTNDDNFKYYDPIRETWELLSASGIESEPAEETAIDNVVTESSTNLITSGAVFGWINPSMKTSLMTQPVGKDNDGKLWTIPGGGGSSFAENVAISDIGEYFISLNVEDALQEIGAEIFGISELLGDGVI